MKKFSAYPVAAMVLLCCVLLSCQKKEDFQSDNLTTPVLKSSAVFVVSPSGNYTDDADAIQTAFNNAVLAGSGSTVKLTEGTFYLNKRIEVDGFDGYFKGAGQQNTIITTHDVITFNLTNGDVEALFKFRHGNLRMSEMSIAITLADPATGAYVSDWFGPAMPVVIMITGNSLSDPATTDQLASASFHKVSIIGGPGTFGEMYNIYQQVLIAADGWEVQNYALTGGNYVFTNCKFKSGGWLVTNWLDNNDTWTIGGTASAANTFEDMFYGVGVGEFSNSKIAISNNVFKKARRTAILMVQGYYLDPSTLSLSNYLVKSNEIEAIDLADGIILIDESVALGGPKLMDATITNNKIFLNNTEWGGIYGEGGSGIIVSNNKIWGNGVSGIYLGIWGYLADHWSLLGNNVQGVNNFGSAPIVLGKWSSDCLVVGGSNMTNVNNKGTNNILTGVNNMQGNSPGEFLPDALQAKHELIKKFKGR